MRLERYEDPPQPGGEMTAMIDVVFQLVLFFVFSLKFRAQEGQLQAYLPADRGLRPEAASAPEDREEAVLLVLGWEPAGGGRVTCRTPRFQRPDGRLEEDYAFPMASTPERDEPGTVLSPLGPPEGTGPFDYAAPRFDRVEAFLAERKAALAGRRPGLSVVLRFDERVPVQPIATILDICSRLRIESFSMEPVRQDAR
ncbi:MAG: biopolymer transporter ExbD [Planctomycetes bacterium]|nr:biopolymer transporter ExbD [Planctomycetota bacterium]